ncbi:MAG: alpha-galactosidase [Rikenellaceae bacterium]|nr:alpha-galactosidase [Rikenellaceae bacterium]MCL2693269.1 alpha-galactosidase [Rikenellaceae bacterium]
MKRLTFLLALLFVAGGANGVAAQTIRISTDATDLILRVADNGRLYQSYLGARLQHEADFQHLPQGREVYLTHGMEDYFEPAVRMTHNDGNPSLMLKYVSHETTGGTTVITMRDGQYPVEVRLFYTAYPRENVIVAHTEISHRQEKPVTIYNYASSMLHFDRAEYYMTDFTGEWAAEVQMTEQQLHFGKRVVDSKLGSRANMQASPMFILALDGPARETVGDVMLGTIGWTGNFRFTFEVDHLGGLRVISGINPYGSEYTLAAGEVFRTPEFIFTLSDSGTGKATRDLHDWARRHRLKDGMGTRLTLLNNWEATYFSFDEAKLVELLDEARKLGVDMFLLDDGWFGNEFPRSSDRQGLGDWEETVEKLPGGISKLVAEATERGLKFGIWIEPEMVNPRSELFERHPEWVIALPNRDRHLFRSQMVLDLSNPAVQDFVFGIVDTLMTRHPGIAYFKWDCNRPMTNIFSPYLENQSHLYIEYVRGLYNVLERVAAKYPDLPMMLCAGGGGRSDYEVLRYFTEFWPSDNTDGVERIFIQWGFGYFFPTKALGAHVTSWGRQPLKFRTDVAMMGKLGFDIRIDGMSEDELEFSRGAVQNFKRLQHVTLDGDLYRLFSPYDGDHAALMYLSKPGDKAVLFAFDMHPRAGARALPSVRLQGLDPARMYLIEEINMMPGQRSTFAGNGKVFSGDYLMRVGLPLFGRAHLRSRVLEITAQ